MEIQRLSPSATPQTAALSGTSPSHLRDRDFGGLFTDLLAKLSALQADADQLAAGLAAGEAVDLHEVMLAMEKASLGFQLALQVRNKVVEAYQEVMRLQL